MKIIFNRLCQDKYTSVVYEVGKVYEFEDDRANEILKSGFAKVFEEAKKIETVNLDEKPKDVEERLNSGEMIDLYSLSKQELVKLAKEQGVSIRGTKEEIIERLLSS